MKNEMLMYIRDKKSHPKGVIYFKQVGSYNEEPVIAVGWSKANKTDVFKKAFGVEIAQKRAEKGAKWTLKNLHGFNNRDYLTVADFESYAISETVPFIVKENLKYYLENAKTHMGIGSVDGGAIFVFPILETVIDVDTVDPTRISTLADAIECMESELKTMKSRTQTRYITIIQ